MTAPASPGRGRRLPGMTPLTMLVRRSARPRACVTTTATTAPARKPTDLGRASRPGRYVSSSIGMTKVFAEMRPNAAARIPVGLSGDIAALHSGHFAPQMWVHAPDRIREAGLTLPSRQYVRPSGPRQAASGLGGSPRGVVGAEEPPGRHVRFDVQLALQKPGEGSLHLGYVTSLRWCSTRMPSIIPGSNHIQVAGRSPSCEACAPPPSAISPTPRSERLGAQLRLPAHASDRSARPGAQRSIASQAVVAIQPPTCAVHHRRQPGAAGHRHRRGITSSRRNAMPLLMAAGRARKVDDRAVHARTPLTPKGQRPGGAARTSHHPPQADPW